MQMFRFGRHTTRVPAAEHHPYHVGAQFVGCPMLVHHRQLNEGLKGF